MELSHSFVVPASVDQAWEAFVQVDSLASCFPGASVTAVEGATFRGSVKVKLGPISLVYSGTGSFLERDQQAGRLVAVAKGKDKRGNGTAGATITAQISDAGEGSTKVDVTTDLQITGKPAQFGRGVIQDVSDKLLQQFVTCLQSKIGRDAARPESDESDGSAAEAEIDPATEAATEPTTEGLAEPAAEPVDDPTPAPAERAPAHRADAAAADETMSAPSEASEQALDLGATVIPILLKSYRRQIFAAVVGLGALLVLRRLLTRH